MTSPSTIPERVAEMHATLAAQPPSEAIGAFAREQPELAGRRCPRREGPSRRGPGERARCGHQAVRRDGCLRITCSTP